MSRFRTAAALLLPITASVLLAGCGSDSTTKTVVTTVTETETVTEPSTTSDGGTSGGGEQCSASDVTVDVKAPGAVPAAVATTRDAIVDAATDCDYAALAQVATGHPGPLKFTYGTETDPAAFWRSSEAKGDEPLGRLAQVLQTTPGRDGAGNFVWPAIAAHDQPTAADYAALEGIYTAAEIASFKRDGYLAWRVGITPKGDWSFFVQGD